MIKIESLGEAHLDSLVILENQCFSIPWIKEMFEGEIKSSMAHYFVATDGDMVVGYVGMWKVLDEGQITNIAVLPTHQRQGIAQSLLLELINLSKRLNITSLTLEVRESNIPAQRLYEKIGFAPVGRRKDYYADTKEAAILMTLEVN